MAPSHVFFGLMRGAIRWRPIDFADEVGEDVTRPDDQQQVQNQKSAGPLLAKLHQHGERQRDVGEAEGGGGCGRISRGQIISAHRDRQENERCNCGGEGGGYSEDVGGEQRFLLASVEHEQHEEQHDHAVGWLVHRRDAVGLGEFQEFLDSDQRNDGGDRRHHGYRRSQHQQQDNRDQD